MRYDIHDKSHVVIRFAVSLPIAQTIPFRPGQEDRALEVGQKTTLTVFFKLNKQDDTGHQYFYHEIPEHFTFTKQKVWQRRQ